MFGRKSRMIDSAIKMGKTLIAMVAEARHLGTFLSSTGNDSAYIEG